MTSLAQRVDHIFASVEREQYLNAPVPGEYLTPRPTKLFKLS